MTLAAKIMERLPGASTFLPVKNRQGVPMVLFSECHNRMSNCPNPLADTAGWTRELKQWAEDYGLSEKLRQRVPGDRILRHHKILFSVSGCPNGCSRPQIADFGVVGFVRPEFDAALCTACGECAKACPDRALTLSGDGVRHEPSRCQGCLECQKACPSEAVSHREAGVRLLVGGKLGRRPHLAVPAGEFSSPDRLAEAVEKHVGEYLSHARPGERFAGFIQRIQEEKRT